MDPAWQTCLTLCLDAINSGSLGIAATVHDSTGAAISRGRNQLFDTCSSPNAIKNTLVSHAEVNAIAGLPNEYRSDKSVVMYTSVEPCPMCLGAIAMSPIRQVVIGSRDPYAGSAALVDNHPWMKRKNIRFQFMSGDVETLFASLHIYSLLQRRDLPLNHGFYTSIQERYPEVYDNMVTRRDDAELGEAIRSHDVGRVKEICAV